MYPKLKIPSKILTLLLNVSRIAFQVANHVFGSVLCSPGCFSVYRVRAIRDVLSQYASGTDTAMDFLVKDMGKGFRTFRLIIRNQINLLSSTFLILSKQKTLTENFSVHKQAETFKRGSSVKNRIFQKLDM